MLFRKLNLLMAGLTAVLVLTVQGCTSPANYPVTRLAGWAPWENVPWEVLDFSAQFESQNFSLYNSTTNLKIKARVRVHGFRTSSYKIKKLHISQRTIEEDIQKVAGIEVKVPGRTSLPNNIFIQRYIEKQGTGKIKFTLIEITPVFEIDERYTTPKPAEFDLVLEEPIQNRTWGRNYYRIQLGDRHIDLGTFQ